MFTEDLGLFSTRQNMPFCYNTCEHPEVAIIIIIKDRATIANANAESRKGLPTKP